MIISHKYQFIFVKTYKTAGTSIEVFLSQRCGKEDIFTPINPYVEPHVARNYQGRWNLIPEILEYGAGELRFTLRNWLRQRKFYNHISARRLKRRVPKEIWDNYFKFCVERNPWDKTLSHYYMLKRRSGNGLTLDEYFEQRQFCLNYPKYTASNGEVIVDKVIKYKFLLDELALVFGQLGIPFDGKLGVKAKSRRQRNRRPYTEVFTPEQRAIIKEVFAKEINIHSYVYQ